MLKRLLIILFISLICFRFVNYISNDLNIYFLDVGQGDCTLIRTSNNKTVLIDGGEGGDNTNFDEGKNTVFPYLLDRGINKIDYIIISHFDSDHVRWTIYCNERNES